MTLVKCPECGREISTLATACPGCGAPRNPDTVHKTFGADQAKLDDRSPKSDRLAYRLGYAYAKMASRFRRVEALVGALVGILLFLSIGGWLNYRTQQEHDKEAAYWAAHPLTPMQKAANDHFVRCGQIRSLPSGLNSGIISERQKAALLALEGCYPDDRDDPRSAEATYPWNGSLVAPWDLASLPSRKAFCHAFVENFRGATTATNDQLYDECMNRDDLEGEPPR